MSAARGRVRIPRELHPVAWWCWAVGLGAAASMTTNPLLLALLVASAWLVVVACRSDQPWSGAFRLYLWVGLAVVVIRVLFRVVLGGVPDGHVLLSLPEVPLPSFAAGITLLGPVTREALLAGLYDGMRLAALLICVGAANALANPKRLMKSMPPALYEIGTSLVVAITVLPQLVDSTRRVRAAQQLRGGPGGRVRGLRRLLVPILEDALDRSLAMAAGMDARGYGRTGGLTAARRRGTGALMLVGLIGICVGAYAVLDGTAPRYLAGPMLGLGVALAVLGLVSAGRRVERTRYRPDPWRAPEAAAILSGLLVALGTWYVGRTDQRVAHPGVVDAPTVSLIALAVVLLALVPALTSPPPLTAASREPDPAPVEDPVAERTAA
ncbi:energy-coupling factor transporter transmembrane component T [Nocardioides pantholopis]|uniref:energy-coupling factor transporter transmembrane component T n=1 Tax=Nocardioides pantholopis TaxID=2483798 RepID=UPI0019D1E326|nr:energy-coupling factor transporter transmembrane component T [Nocardioides pantholopis]